MCNFCAVHSKIDNIRGKVNLDIMDRKRKRLEKYATHCELIVKVQRVMCKEVILLTHETGALASTNPLTVLLLPLAS